jgi:hypothetical protein
MALGIDEDEPPSVPADAKYGAHPDAKAGERRNSGARYRQDGFSACRPVRATHRTPRPR